MLLIILNKGHHHFLNKARLSMNAVEPNSFCVHVELEIIKGLKDKYAALNDHLLSN